ncbi:helix-hairpin-helix domain-containing protein [Gramella jeungdoensis]|uniref:Helix-hairpin-helix domain-containing protein n=1 Tax=Gramella jeungdoensis TaxID=708091 RepID=A0ABT0YX76_9FLAO|nr:helix-hairpin-helix domain-containing protein [Gramella jeungdoensis]MCM8568067.1 helix-hairpin-helix domain-containing protein [Gramella jeungdoensis]
MKLLKSHFALSRSQQNGIFVLVLLIIIFQAILLFDFYPPSETQSIPESQMLVYQRQLDSLKNIQAKKKDTIYPFNPNFITDFKAYQLGMSVEEIDRFLAYRSADKWVNSAVEFQKVTGISDSLLRLISASFRFPNRIQKPVSIKAGVKDSSGTSAYVTDLNSASAEDLIKVKGVGEVLSRRIVKYRQSIGGFRNHIQLNDVYGLTPEVVQNILQSFQILTRPDSEVRNINDITVSELAEIPYFNYELALKVINYRKLHEGITSFEELSKIDGFPSDKIDRIKLYLALQ